ncbi:hypothetical protein CY34DRAFT_803098 [Suillus luteus UH-Slu-Lm8-n1]|uniref:Uncharacterized protein n=1 Tax=Suillus luteus UH-Slu-Lm8-n1 TaxID=930992 RepID=A0A0D0A2B7_9AGAM|nr:hypothetical protein CY34DRAFT_803098 [Suillus luteus UH-Slu-Lm8-n1]
MRLARSKTYYEDTSGHLGLVLGGRPDTTNTTERASFEGNEKETTGLTSAVNHALMVVLNKMC